MTAMLRLGSIVIVKDLAQNPLGTLARGVLLSGDHADRHVLVRSYDGPLAGPHTEQHRESLARRMGRLAGSRGLGAGHALLPAPHLGYAQDYIPGRTLTQVLARAEEDMLGLGHELALTVAAGICQALTQAHSRGLRRGLLGPDSVWIGFDGSVTLLDACLSEELETGAAGPGLGCEWVAPATWLQGRRDDQVLARLLTEMLTATPVRSCPPGKVLEVLTAKVANSEEPPLPPALTRMVARLLGEHPYPSLGEASLEFEGILAHGEFGPTTFTLAFFMHQAFRQETFRDDIDEKEELGMVFKKRALVAPEGMVEPLQPSGRRSKKALLAAAALITLGAIGGGVATLRSDRVYLARQEARFHAEQQRHEQRLSELARAEAELTARMRELSSQTLEASSPEARHRAERALIESRKAKEALVRQRLDLVRAEPTAHPPAKAAAFKEEPTPLPTQVALAAMPSTAAPSGPAVLVPAAPRPGAQGNLEARVLTPGNIAPAIWAQARSIVPAVRLVRVRVFVDRNGKGLKSLMMQPQDLPVSLEGHFREAALQSSFSPALRQGEPAAAWVVVEFPAA